MTCVICNHGQTQPGKVTVTLERDGCTVIFKQVPADVCENCGEYYLSQTVTDELMALANQAVNSGAEVQIMRYAA